MLRIALLDDNEFQLSIEEEMLQEYLREQSLPAEVRVFQKGSDLLEHVKEHGPFDMYLLDVMMPETNGMEIATILRLQKDDGEIVFLTASAEYAVQSYEVKAANYLLKPINRDKFCQVIGQVLLKRMNDTRENTLTVTTVDGPRKIRLEDIQYVKVEDRRPIWVLRENSGERRQIQGPALRGRFRDMMSVLLRDDRFVECGPSCVVRMSAVESVEDDYLLMRNWDVLYVSRGAAAEFKKKWLAR
ncbi:MAG: hypothetical protein CW338_06970 [Clostridiales bacterium]|nr:hypothetical protein [Clostridiales bacterium]